jgi:5-methylcytosine-specific restriction endonuclease McrA
MLLWSKGKGNALLKRWSRFESGQERSTKLQLWKGGHAVAVHALLLNASMEPLKVVSERRAVVLVLSGKAEMVEPSDARFRHERGEVIVPAVLRLVRFVKVPYRTTIPLTRKAVLARDGGLCAYCSKEATTMDHVTPRARGGLHRWENVVAACKPCNAKKDDHSLAELGWTLRFTPRAPKASLYVVFRYEQNEAWTPYLSLA